MTVMQPEARALRLTWLEETMLSLVSLRAGEVRSNRRNSVLACIRHEIEIASGIGRLMGRSVDEIHQLLSQLESSALDLICCRCLFYACDELILYLCNKKFSTDPIAREEAVLYVQERLHRDDFRRIRAFQMDNGVTFKTYIWQVITNLLKDFFRAYGKTHSRTLSSDAMDSETFIDTFIDNSIDNAEPINIDVEVEAQQVTALLKQLSTFDPSRAATTEPSNAPPHSLHQRLRPFLTLSSRERLFLKALCQHDLSIGEIRQLPGFRMSQNEAYRFYYQVIGKLVEVFKQAGVLNEVRHLITDREITVQVAIGNDYEEVSVRRLLYLKKGERDSAHCHLDWQGQVTTASLKSKFSKLRKQLAAFFTPINPSTLIADRILETLDHDWQAPGTHSLSLENIDETFAVTDANLKTIRSRFYAKQSD